MKSSQLKLNEFGLTFHVIQCDTNEISFKLKDLNVNRNIIYIYIYIHICDFDYYVFHRNIGNNMHRF